ncbi:cytochrome c family protein [Polynucleobacter necessarius]|uniref:hypothetical protein n=1 Tax=Polynucleobacter necessarius TaxID=576610 RepID=UPI001E3EC3E4|nr:hypothetical protein [Polynucleobacter necessarius]
MRYVLAAVLLVVLNLGQARAQAIVNGAIADPLTAIPGDPQRGRAIVASRQTGLCLLCHSGPFPEERFQGNLAPEFSVSVARYTAPQLRARIVDAVTLIRKRSCHRITEQRISEQRISIGWLQNLQGNPL